MFYLWDGMAFFGFDDNKLERLKGRAPRWYDPFRNIRWVLTNILVLTVVIYIVSTVAQDFGHIKS